MALATDAYRELVAGRSADFAEAQPLGAQTTGSPGTTPTANRINNHLCLELELAVRAGARCGSYLRLKRISSSRSLPPDTLTASTGPTPRA